MLTEPNLLLLLLPHPVLLLLLPTEPNLLLLLLPHPLSQAGAAPPPAVALEAGAAAPPAVVETRPGSLASMYSDP